MLSIKAGPNGVSNAGLKPETLLGLTVVAFYFKENNWHCQQTSGLEGKHSTNSLHYVGLAFDIGSRHVPEMYHGKVTDDLRERLGDEFDVVYEKNHWHIEYQPEKRL